MTTNQYIDSRFDIEELREMGVLTTEKTYEEIADRLCKFFGLENIVMYDFILKEDVVPVKADIESFSSN